MHRRFFFGSLMTFLAGLFGFRSFLSNQVKPLGFTIKRGVAFQQLNKAYCWFHPRVAAIPSPGAKAPIVMMTLQQHLGVSDYYSGLYYMQTEDLGKTWVGPRAIAELQMEMDEQGNKICVVDVTPGWHDPTQKLLAIGIKVKYGQDGKQLLDAPLSHNCAYTAYDPTTKKWAAWKELPPLPHDPSKFFLLAPGCVQWIVKADGTVLLPVYFSGKNESDHKVTVLHCKFDGADLAYLQHSTELVKQGGRGFTEPSLAFWNKQYYLTLRNDQGAYVSTSTDALHWSAPIPWLFDNGQDLGSYNTQAHWLVHQEGLFLSYTRRGANNDHVFRNRAPIFIGQVDPERLCILRSAEQTLIPERGVMLGNFGAVYITEHESWVTDAEFMIGEQPHARGADGSLWVARVCWSKPNGIEAPV